MDTMQSTSEARGGTSSLVYRTMRQERQWRVNQAVIGRVESYERREQTVEVVQSLLLGLSLGLLPIISVKALCFEQLVNFTLFRGKIDESDRDLEIKQGRKV